MTSPHGPRIHFGAKIHNHIAVVIRTHDYPLAALPRVVGLGRLIDEVTEVEKMLEVAEMGDLARGILILLREERNTMVEKSRM
jgi:hypothetical protein